MTTVEHKTLLDALLNAGAYSVADASPDGVLDVMDWYEAKGAVRSAFIVTDPYYIRRLRDLIAQAPAELEEPTNGKAE